MQQNPGVQLGVQGRTTAPHPLQHKDLPTQSSRAHLHHKTVRKDPKSRDLLQTGSRLFYCPRVRLKVQV